MHARYSWIISLLGALGIATVVLVCWYLHQPSLPPIAVAPTKPNPAGSTKDAAVARTAQEALVLGQTAATSPQLRAAPERPALAPVSPRTDVPPLGTAKDLLRPNQTGLDDLRTVFSLFERYRSMFGAFPTGEDNASMVNALTGNNPQRAALLERDHVAINAHGELVDRWQMPLFFHFQSHDELEVRSSGPDREIYTADDLLQRSPSMEQVKLQPE